MTSLNIPAPKPLNISQESRSQNWELFRQSYENYELATGLKDKNQDQRVAVLLSIIGYDALRVYNAFHWPEGEEKTVESVLQRFECYCKPKLNVTYERFSFMSRKQRKDESINDYIVSLKNLVKNCQYEHLTDSLMRDAIVMGINNKKTQEVLLRENDLTLDKCINIIRATERAHQQFNYISEDQSSSGYERMEVNKMEVKSTKNEVRSCKFCGSSHVWGRDKCPAFGKTCSNCQEKNHFKRVCKKKARLNANVRNVNIEDEEENFEIN